MICSIRNVVLVSLVALLLGCDAHYDHDAYIFNRDDATQIQIDGVSYTSYLECLHYAGFATHVSYPALVEWYSFPTYESFPRNHTCWPILRYVPHQNTMYIGVNENSRWMTPYGLIGFDLSENFRRWGRLGFCSQVVTPYGNPLGDVRCHTFGDSYLNFTDDTLRENLGYRDYHDVWSLAVPEHSDFFKIWMLVVDPLGYEYKFELNLNKIVPADSNALAALATSCRGIIAKPGYAADLDSVCHHR